MLIQRYDIMNTSASSESNSSLYRLHHCLRDEHVRYRALKTLIEAFTYLTRMRPMLQHATCCLSLKELLILMLLGTGYTIRECAKILGYTYGTVLTYENRSRRKLQTHSSAHSLALAVQQGYLQFQF